jgi:hypothetical protein
MIPTSATSKNFSGSLNLRLLDGSKNGVYYTIPAASVSMKGTATVKKNDSLGGANATYAYLYTGADSGKGTKICSTSFTLSSGSKTFSASGKTTKSSKCYLYFFKVEDDGRDLSLSGTLNW